MNNWISFGGGYPPFEMLLRPCSNDEHSSVPFSLYSGDQFVDFFGSEQRSPPPPLPLACPSSAGATDGQGASSPLTIYQDPSCQVIPVAIPLDNSEVEELVEAGGNQASLNGQSPESVCQLSAEEEKEVAVTTAVAARDGKARGKKTAMTVVGSGQRSSVFRGVTRHRWTGRYEAHLWDNTCRREGQKRKGRQVYLGGYDKEEKAAKAYDLAALKYWGVSAITNFPASSYSQEMEIMKNMTKQEFIASIRRNSSGFSRGASIYRGVTRHHQHGRWQARIGRVAGNKDLYLGTFSTQEEAAEAYDVAAIKFRGSNAVTNFSLSRYDVEAIANSELPIGMSSAKRMKASNSSQLSGYNMEAVANMEASVSTSDNRVKLQALVNNSTALTVTTANTISNFELSRYNSEAIPNNEVPLGELAKWMKDAFPANSTHQVLLANSTSSTLKHPNNEPSASLHNHFQLESSTVIDPSIPLAYYGLGDEGSPDLCGQNFYWPLAQQSGQIHCSQTALGGSEALQLTF